LAKPAAKSKSKAKAKPTAYQQKTRRISKWRSFKRNAASFLKRGYYATAAVGCAMVIGAGWWFVHSGKLDLMVEGSQNAVLAQTKKAGLSLQYIYLEGRSNFKKQPGEKRDKYMEQVTASLGLKPGDPILGLSVGEIQERIKQISWVKDAVVERQLPDTLYVHIQERRPVAVWQYRGQLKLVDESGHIIVEEKADAPKYRHLLLVVGEGAPEHTTELMRMLSAEPELFPLISSAVRVGERRWDIRMINKLEVRLPSQNQEKAWATLAKMEREQRLLQKDIRAVDLRLEDRIYIDMPEAAKKEKVKPVNSRDT